MNVDDFLDGLERTRKNLPDLLDEFDTVDEELQYEYVEQLTWLFMLLPEVLAEHNDYPQVIERIKKIVASYQDIKDKIWDVMGVRI